MWMLVESYQWVEYVREMHRFADGGSDVLVEGVYALKLKPKSMQRWMEYAPTVAQMSSSA